MSEPLQHLGPDLLNRLVEAGEGGHSDAELENAAQHAAGCPECGRRVAELRAAQAQLDGLRLGISEERMRTPECPPESEWPRVAAGLVDADQAAAWMDHAARCSYCGPLLREATEDFSDEWSEEEKRLLSQLPSARKEVQQPLAARLAMGQTPAPASKQPAATRRRWIWAWSAAVAVAAAVLIAFLVIGRQGAPEHSARQLLAQAYSANRVLQLRIPGAAYAPMATERGESATRPLPLLRAEVLIVRQLAAHPSSAAWLALDGRAQLVAGHFSQARTTLEQALRFQPDSPSILTDLATAEYELGLTEERDEDFMAAAQHLSQALELEPKSEVALFNRALVYERIGSLPLAMDDWQRYLKLDPSSEWATKVARLHLDRLKKQLSASPKAELPPASPRAAAAWLAVRMKQPQDRRDSMNSADEELLDVAVKNWLPDFYSHGGALAPQQQAKRSALERLANELSLRHHDQWLKDVLEAPSTRSTAPGLEALGRAVRLNEEGRPDEGLEQAQRAVKLLGAARNPALLRAQTELAYAYELESNEATACLGAARQGLDEVGGRAFPWIEGQLLLDEAVCDNILWHLTAFRQETDRAVNVACESGYGALYLRAIGFQAGFASDVDDYRDAWRDDRAGLEEYWRGEFPPIRAYQFFSDMTFDAEDAGDWLVAEALAKEGVGMIRKTPNRSWEAIARFRLATLANLAGDRTTARKQFQRASNIFASLPPDPSFITYEGVCQINLADFEVQTGEPELALKRLLRMRPMVERATGSAFAPNYFRALGEAYLAEGSVAKAEDSLLDAAAIAERGLFSLRSGADRVSWTEWYAGVYRGLVRTELEGRQDPVAALGLWEWYRSGPVRAQENAGDSAERLLPMPPSPRISSDAADFARLRANLSRWIRSRQAGLRKETVVSYAQFRDGVEIWTLDDRGISARWVAVPKREFNRVARRFGRECADPKSNLDLLRSDGRKLYGWLIAPVAERLSPGRAIAFETDRAIGEIPFAALVGPHGKYLGSRFAILLSPGLGYQNVRGPKARFTGADHMLAIGAPAIEGAWASLLPPLPEADSEARAVAADFRQATLLTGRAASAEAVLRALPDAQILHFAGHALAEGSRRGLLLAAGNDTQEWNSGRERARGAEVLAAAQINSRELRECRLVVLSACSTASGEGAALVDPEGLVGAFLLAGVPDVVASRWNVNSAVTTRLMEKFYKRLLAGDGVAVALERAARVVRQAPATAHPYYWAAFSVYVR